MGRQGNFHPAVPTYSLLHNNYTYSPHKNTLHRQTVRPLTWGTTHPPTQPPTHLPPDLPPDHAPGLSSLAKKAARDWVRSSSAAAAAQAAQRTSRSKSFGRASGVRASGGADAVECHV